MANSTSLFNVNPSNHDSNSSFSDNDNGSITLSRSPSSDESRPLSKSSSRDSNSSNNNSTDTDTETSNSSNVSGISVVEIRPKDTNASHASDNSKISDNAIVEIAKDTPKALEKELDNIQKNIDASQLFLSAVQLLRIALNHEYKKELGKNLELKIKFNYLYSKVSPVKVAESRNETSRKLLWSIPTEEFETRNKYDLTKKLNENDKVLTQGKITNNLLDINPANHLGYSAMVDDFQLSSAYLKLGTVNNERFAAVLLIMEYLIDVLEVSVGMNDYHSVFIFTSVFFNLERLMGEMHNVTIDYSYLSEKARNTYSVAMERVSTQSNFANLRLHIQSLETPYIPHMGIFTRDMATILLKNPQTTEEEKDKIRKALKEVIQEIKKAQQANSSWTSFAFEKNNFDKDLNDVMTVLRTGYRALVKQLISEEDFYKKVNSNEVIKEKENWTYENWTKLKAEELILAVLKKILKPENEWKKVEEIIPTLIQELITDHHFTSPELIYLSIKGYDKQLKNLQRKKFNSLTAMENELINLVTSDDLKLIKEFLFNKNKEDSEYENKLKQLGKKLFEAQINIDLDNNPINLLGLTSFITNKSYVKESPAQSPEFQNSSSVLFEVSSAIVDSLSIKHIPIKPTKENKAKINSEIEEVREAQKYLQKLHLYSTQLCASLDRIYAVSNFQKKLDVINREIKEFAEFVKKGIYDRRELFILHIQG